MIKELRTTQRLKIWADRLIPHLRQAPTLAMGSIYVRAKVKNTTGLFTTRIGASEDSCQFLFKFKSNKLIVRTIDGQYNCGFGHGVYVDGIYKRISSKNPTFI